MLALAPVNSSVRLLHVIMAFAGTWAMKTFLSSTYLDLKDHRHAAIEALERLGQEVGRMEVFGARPDEPTTACLNEVKACDLFVGVYAYRYGFIPPEAGVSITEQEFNHAVQLGKPIFCFFVNEDYPWPPKLVEGEEPGRTKLSEFKQRAGDRIVRDIFTTPEDLALKVVTAIGHYLAKGRLDKLTSQFHRSMNAADLDPLSLARGRSLSDVPEGTRELVKRLLHDLMYSIDQLTIEQSSRNEDIDPDTILALAQGFMAEGKWFEAAKKYEEYAPLRPSNWEVHYVRGVAFANSRKDSETNLSSVRAYNDAIAFAPPEIEPNMRARLFAYRGAIFKRLGRLDEAEADLQIARKFATRKFEILDIQYNFACLYALRGEREKLMASIKSIREYSNYFGPISAIHAHLDDYFAAYANDAEFLQAIGA
jgi:tetratricopeptide (TPR) repeat protein